MVAPKRDSKLEKIAAEATWRISTAVAVDGIMRLYSSNPKRDANLMCEGDAHTRDVLLEGPKDKSPLRSAYIFRTIGVQAIFDILRKLASDAFEERNISSGYFEKILTPAKEIDFSSTEFQNASGSGRTFIRKAIENAIGI